MELISRIKLVIGGVLLPAIALTGSKSSEARDFFVSGAGSDSAVGTKLAPWSSIARVNRQQLSPGDHIYFEAGTIFRGTLVFGPRRGGARQAPVLVSSYGAGRATIDAENESGLTITNTAGMVIENLRFVGRGGAANRGSGIRAVNDVHHGPRLRFLRIQNVEVTGFGLAGIFVGGLATDGTQEGFDDVRIENVDAHDNVYYGVIIGGPWDDDHSSTVTSGLQDSGLRAGYTNSKVYIGYTRAWNNLGDADFHANHSGSGVFVADTDEALVEFSSAWNNGALDLKSPGGPAGIWAAGSNRVVIQSCESHHNHTGEGNHDGDGFDFDGGMSNSILQYNYSHDNDGFGILVYNYKGAPHAHVGNIVRFNISQNDGGRKMDGASVGVLSDGDPINGLEIYNNTIYSTTSAYKISTIAIKHGVGQAVIFNNLLVMNGNEFVLGVEESNPRLEVIANAYWNVNEPMHISWGGSVYPSLSSFRKGAGQEVVNGKATGLEGDPRVRGLGKAPTLSEIQKITLLREYRLEHKSPLFGKGIERDGVRRGQRDFFGRSLPSKGASNIGADAARQ